MTCPLCHERKAKRACPALGRDICAVCCGTKRLVEIACPADCVYLVSARSHPPAIVQRRQERDRDTLLPLLEGLTERQTRLFLMFAAVVSRHQGDALQKFVDADTVQAADALAATLETAARGIVYQHQPASLPAARLMAELSPLVAEVAKKGGSALERDAAIALRRIERGARQSTGVQPHSAQFQELLARVLGPQAGANTPEAEPTAPASSLIIP